MITLSQASGERFDGRNGASRERDRKNGVGSMTFILATGWAVDHFGYTPVLTVAGALAPIGAIVLFALAGVITKIRAT